VCKSGALKGPFTLAKCRHKNASDSECTLFLGQPHKYDCLCLAQGVKVSTTFVTVFCVFVDSNSPVSTEPKKTYSS
jgi:hypothetical protein